ncbi:hypothetical protein DAMA08_018620 [Martiniozyma asiatica (nom. inval.)]|nr:hypothetical protein DAMA08_018620 [Martiniozyma asiatica]
MLPLLPLSAKTPAELLSILQTEPVAYAEISPFLNDSNCLLMGPSNLVAAEKIELIRVFTASLDNESLKILSQHWKDCLVVNTTFSTEQIVSNHLIAYARLGTHLTSHRGIIHGGMSATLIDEYFVKVCLPLTKSGFAVTGSLSVKYFKPLKISKHKDGQYVDVILDCFVEKVEGRKFVVKGGIRGFDGIWNSFGEAVVIEPKETIV